VKREAGREGMGRVKEKMQGKKGEERKWKKEIKR
jgi:hypothetical protein